MSCPSREECLKVREGIRGDGVMYTNKLRWVSTSDTQTEWPHRILVNPFTGIKKE